MERQTISACMIVQNEEIRIKDSIENIVNYVDEIIILDGGSTDNTVEICKSFAKVRLFEVPFDGKFGEQRNRSLEKAVGNWILVKDADELFDFDFLDNIQRVLESGYQAFGFPRKTRIDGKLYNIIENDSQIRLWKNGIGVKYEGALHESPSGFKSLAPCNMYIEHNKTTEEQQKDNETYWDLGQSPPEGWKKIDGKWIFNK